MILTTIYIIFRAKEIRNQPRFYIPQIFSRLDACNNTLYLNAGERFNLFCNAIKPESLTMYETKKKSHLSAKKLSACVNLTEPNVKIPEEPIDVILTIIKRRGILDMHKRIKQVW